ncbi:hypothetical protein DLM76_18565 [Leptospira yasudae]|uniref:PseG/SpsG family protein n=1 Tax=Leptospira yasudae TaxID=2202201 RepID=UPI000E59FB0D|nr:hypothetical protein [Leptospira yasudae]RHX91166.1 hypothetical protein DLM76_18565 [Leptospira yasudae]
MIYIFTEYFQKAGLGHFRRCSALADLFREKNFSVELIIDSDVADFLDTNVSFYNWTSKGIKDWLNKRPQVIIIDSYQASLAIYEQVIATGIRLICIDDFNRLTYPKSAIIYNGGLGGTIYNYRSRYSKVIDGPEYVLLRKPFCVNLQKPNIPEKIRTILISMGGSDPKNTTQRILLILDRYFPEIDKEVIVGPAFEEAHLNTSRENTRTIFHKNLGAEEIKNLMQSAHLCISAGGQTTYELARLGIPMVLIKTAENQIGNLIGFQKLGIIDEYLNADDDQFEIKLKNAVSFASSFEFRIRMSQILQETFIDHSSKIVEAILG